MDPPALPGHHGEGDRAEPGDEGRPAHDEPLAAGPELREADPREDPVLDEHDRPHRHEQQAVDPDEVEELREDERRAGHERRDRPGDEGHLPARPVRGDHLEGEAGPVERGVRRRPARDHDREGAGDAERLARDVPRVELGERLLGHERGGRPHDPRADPGHVVADVHAEGGEEPVARLPREAEDRHVRQAHVHRQVADPGEGHDVPEAEPARRVLGGALPDRLVGDRPEVGEAVDPPVRAGPRRAAAA